MCRVSVWQDAEKMESLAQALGGPSELKPNAEGGELQKSLAVIAERAGKGEFLYTKFFAIGLFRLLEITGAKDPKALETLVTAMNIPMESVNRDLMTYKVTPAQQLDCCAQPVLAFYWADLYQGWVGPNVRLARSGSIVITDYRAETLSRRVYGSVMLKMVVGSARHMDCCWSNANLHVAGGMGTGPEWVCCAGSAVQA
jgi:hypothetical protein